jgi:hypothetical protein
MEKDATYGLAAVDESGDHSDSGSLDLRRASGTHYCHHILISWPRVQRTLSCTGSGMNGDPIPPYPRLEDAAAGDVVQNQWAAIKLHAIHFFFLFLWFFLLPKVV